jgi:hypothetical protein
MVLSIKYNIPFCATREYKIPNTTIELEGANNNPMINDFYFADPVIDINQSISIIDEILSILDFLMEYDN